MINSKPVVKFISPANIPSFLNEKNDDDFALLAVANTAQDIGHLRSHMERLINKYCIYIVCAGTKAEAMYDMIEESIIRLNLDRKVSETSDMISTVWYPDIPPETIAAHFLDLNSPETSLYLVALLDSDPLSQNLRADLDKLVN
ncbi:MAG: hypothetical protein COB54_00490 [Alphaproteobacteria bacterium]|nr:MAG: hypothetical protein COB54_00490 [Alphaproteobacteria bacterium]